MLPRMMHSVSMACEGYTTANYELRVGVCVGCVCGVCVCVSSVKYFRKALLSQYESTFTSANSYYTAVRKQNALTLILEVVEESDFSDMA